MGRSKTNANRPTASEEPAGYRGGGPPAGDDDGENPQTVMFPPPQAAGLGPTKRSSAADKPGRRGRPVDEYPHELMFQPTAQGRPGGSVDEYPETVMFPPPAPGGSVEEYPETVMFPPRAPGHAGGSVDEYPETVMFPPPAPGGSVEEYPETVMFPPRPPDHSGGSVEEYPEAVMVPPPATGRPVGPVKGYPPTVVFPPTQPRPPRVVHGSQAQLPQPRPQPLPAPSPIAYGNPWSTGLFDCEGDSTNTVMTAFFPCVTFGQIAEILDQGRTSCTLGSLMYALLLPILSCAIVGTPYRSRLRQMYNLVEAPGEDWILHIFCPCCALCQEYRELQHRGYDPSVGWMGNLALQQAKTPPRTSPMHR
ncbi:unnamed protein product [Musa acuminata subsp. burmannicoides]